MQSDTVEAKDTADTTVTDDAGETSARIAEWLSSEQGRKELDSKLRDVDGFLDELADKRRLDEEMIHQPVGR